MEVVVKVELGVEVRVKVHMRESVGVRHKSKKKSVNLLRVL